MLHLATGTYGTVFNGSFRGHSVAIKQLKHDSHYDAGKFEETVLTEAEFLAGLQHPSIVKFYGVAKEAITQDPGHLETRDSAPGKAPGFLVVTELCDTVKTTQ